MKRSALTTAIVFVVLHGVAFSRETEPLRLRLLCVHDPSEENEPWQGPIHEVLEPVANHLGLRLDHVVLGRDVLPDLEQSAGYRGIVSWFADERVPDASGYVSWLLEQIAAGRRLLVIEGLGKLRDEASGNEVEPALLERLDRAMGLRRTPAWTDNPALIEIERLEAPVVGWERALEGEQRWFDGIEASDPEAEVLLRLRRRDRPEVRCDAVVIGPRASWVAPGYAVWNDPAAPHGARWRVDPWTLLERAFSLEHLPRPDVTTLNGVRLAYAQIDGDGFENLCEFEPGRPCAEVVFERVLRPFAFPTTVGLITAPLDRTRRSFAGPHALEIAREIAALPHVEIASHSDHHPFDWRSGKRSYIPLTGPFDPVFEVERSVEVLERWVAPAGKPIGAMLWSGEGNPDGRTILAARRLGLVNIGGPGTRRDAARSSATWLQPYARRVGTALQVLPACANEMAFLDVAGRYRGGMRHVIETWKRTEAPRRTHAVSLYYHFYSAENAPAFAGLERAIGWLREHLDELYPVFASRYARIVEGFDRVRIERRSDGGFEVIGRGVLGTLRFDDEPRHPDLNRCEGVLGWSRRNHALYVHLDPVCKRPVIYLTSRASGRAWLVEANVAVRGWRAVSRSSLRFEFEGARWARLRLAGLRPRARYRLRLGGERASEEQEVVTDADGGLSLRPKRSGTITLELEVKR